jgi:hypothetical protein
MQTVLLVKKLNNSAEIQTHYFYSNKALRIFFLANVQNQ